MGHRLPLILPKSLWELLQAESEKTGAPMGEIVRRALGKHFAVQRADLPPKREKGLLGVDSVEKARLVRADVDRRFVPSPPAKPPDKERRLEAARTALGNPGRRQVEPNFK